MIYRSIKRYILGHIDSLGSLGYIDSLGYKQGYIDLYKEYSISSLIYIYSRIAQPPESHSKDIKINPSSHPHERYYFLKALASNR